MNFLLLFLLGIAVLILTTVIMNGLVKNFKKRFPECDSVPFMSGITVLLSSLCVGLYFSWETKITIPVLCLFLALCILQQILLTFQNKTREILLFFVCFGTTFLIPTDGTFFKVFPFISGQLLLGGLLYLMTRLFSFMDKINGYSLARLFSLGILFILFFHFRILPNSLQVPFFLLFISFIGIIQTVRTLTNDHKTVLGPFASVLVGFEVGIFICYVMSKGAYSFPIALYSLDITEIILAGITTLFINRHIYPLTQPLPIEQAYNKGGETKKLNRFIFSILLIQSLLAFMFFFHSDISLLLPTLFVLMFCTEYRFKNWDRPIPRYKDMFSDIKQGVIELKNQANYVPLKKNAKPKKKKQGKAKK